MKTKEHMKRGGDTAEVPDTVVAEDTNCEAHLQVDDNVAQLSPAWEGATTDDNGVELICIDDDDDPLVVKVHS